MGASLEFSNDTADFKHPQLGDPGSGVLLSRCRAGEQRRDGGHETTQHCQNRRRGTPPLTARVLVFDCLNETIDIISIKDVMKARGNGDKMKELYLDPSRKEVALFVDAETQSKVSTEQDKNGHSTLLTKIYLDRLGPMASLSRMFGGLQRIYVRNVDALSW